VGNTLFEALLHRPEVVTLFKALESIPVRLVGGCVRDAFLGIQSTDIDVAVAVPPQKVMELLTDNHIKVVPTGIDFGTVTAVINHQSFEITSLREDIQTDGRRARVSFGTDWLKDAERRDFTINALYLDKDGTLYDYFNGIKDLEKGRIAFIGDPIQRIHEDYLRILRYYRFMAYFGKGEPLIIPALKDLRLGLKRLSIERVQAEILKLLMAPQPEKALEAMVSDTIFKTLYNHYVNLEGLFKVIKIERSLNLPPKAFRRLFALFYSATKKIPSFYESRFRFSHHKKNVLATMNKYLDHPDKRWVLYKQNKHGYDFFQDWRVLCFALLEEDSDEKLEALKQDLEWAYSHPSLKLPIIGKDLLEQGLSPGPKVGRMLLICEKWWVENDFKPTRQECLDFVMTKNNSFFNEAH
jgi:poly(A) polymerase